MAKQGRAIEIHCNAASNPAATGVECIGLHKDKELCQRISAAISSITGGKLRGDKGWIDQSQSARGKLGFVSAGGVIIELFFLSNADDLSRYESVKWLIASCVVSELIA